MSVVTAAIALGSNLGDRRGNLERAVALLRATTGVKRLRVSGWWENPAVGGPAESPPFLNGAAVTETTLSARQLLDLLLEIERQLGRVRGEKWGPRGIDLDLLLYGDAVIAEEGLVVPHPLMEQRDFVLRPLAEIAPGMVHPGVGKTVGELLGELEGRGDADQR